MGYTWTDARTGATGESDTYAEARLYAARGGIERWLHRTIRDPHLCEQAVADSLVRLWEVLTDPAETQHAVAVSATDGWLITFGYWRGLDWLRAHTRRTRRDTWLTRLEARVPDPAPTLDDQVLEGETWRLVAQLAAELSPEERRTFAALLEGGGARATATLLGSDRATVQKHQRALQRAARRVCPELRSCYLPGI